MARSIFLASLLLAVSAHAGAAAGDLDPTFGTAGIGQGSAVMDELGRSYTLGSVPDTCPGQPCSLAVLKRTTPDGVLDTTFGNGGGVTTDQRASSILRRLPDGTFLVHWSYFVFQGGGSHTDYGVYKLQADGSRNMSFQSPSYVSHRDFEFPFARSRLDTFADGRFLFANHNHLARYLANGNIDPTFNGGNTVFAGGDYFWNIATPLPDGGAVLAGFRFATSSPDEMLRMLPSGARDPAFGNAGSVPLSADGVPANALGLLRLADGKLLILLASAPAENSPRHLEVRRYQATGQLDTTFGVGGSTLLPAVVAFNSTDASPQPDLLATDAQGRIIVGGTDIAMGTGRIFVARLLANGSIDGSFGNDGVSYFDLTSDQDDVGAVAVQPGGRILVMTRRGGVDGTTLGIRAESGALALSPPVLLPGGVARPYIYHLSVSGGTSPYTFTLASGALPSGVSISASGVLSGTPAGPGRSRFTVRVTDSAGAEELRFYVLDIHDDTSLIHEAYRAVLGREPDGAGTAFWESEVDRVVALGADPTDALHALTVSFFNSAEFKARVLSNRDFVTYLYRTYLGREPDAAGLDWWASELSLGLPRNAALTSFLFAAEYESTMARIFGERTSRAEVRMVIDFYRGLLGRLPDSAGFQFWLGRFRAAQCAGTVSAEADAISKLFLDSSEYAQRQAALAAAARDSEYVVDLYNAFLRRGAERTGVENFLELLRQGASREDLRRQFVSSSEFQGRVATVIAQGCIQ